MANHGGLDEEQWRNAQIIDQVGVQMGMSTRDIQIALITALQESSLRNLNYGDRDSLGLFQQRPSQGWGTPAQVTNPMYASRKFYSALKGLGQRRNDMSMTQAAQAVQRSAFPDAYAAHIPLVRDIWPTLQSKVGANPTDMSGNPYGQPRPVDNGFQQVGLSTPDNQPNTASVLGSQSSGMLDTPNLGSVAAPSFDPNTGLAQPYLDPTTQPWASELSPDTNAQMRGGPDLNVTLGKGVNGWRRAVVDAARGALGTPYVWGGNSLQNGVDCSGLVQEAFRKAGISLPRVSYQQANSGTRIPLKALRPGDLVAYDNSTRNPGADHIAIYIGNGQIIEAPRPGIGVRIRRLGAYDRQAGAWGVRMSG